VKTSLALGFSSGTEYIEEEQMNTRLGEYLDREKVSYQQEHHRTAYTAQQVAAEEHIAGKMMAKTVVVKADDRFLLAVLPGSMRTDMARLKSSLGVNEIRLASELEFAGLFPDCELGAMPPFGNLYDLPVYADKSLAKVDEIVFNAGTHQDTIRIKYADYARLAQPTLLEFAERRAA
jgi:Ala-tRNA(Pro) deacylase